MRWGRRAKFLRRRPTRAEGIRSALLIRRRHETDGDRVVEGSSAEPSERYRGHIDRIQGSVIEGWCCDTSRPDETVVVEAVVSNGKRIIAIASVFRQDVRDAGFGNGNHGFRIDLSGLALKDETVVVRFLHGKSAITKTPITLDAQQALLSEPMPPIIPRPHAPTRGGTQGQARRDAGDRDETRSGHLRIDAPECTMTSSSFDLDGDRVDLRGRADAMFDAANPAEDPEGLITKFVAYESYRIKREQHVFEMVGTVQDRLGVLFWYLTDYVRDRQGGYLVPLSARQLAYLNSPAPLAGASPAVTVALYNFVARDLPSHLNLLDPKVLREALYWWCVERAPRSRFEDRLVTERADRGLA